MSTRVTKFRIVSLGCVLAASAALIPSGAAFAAQARSTPSVSVATPVTVLASTPEDAVTRWRRQGWPQSQGWRKIGGVYCYAGGEFSNNEQLLKAKYAPFHEYDVQCYPTIPGNRGLERIVVGAPDKSGQPSCYSYTPDHYHTFRQIGALKDCTK
ncbi:guanyl-specific ribonuclease Sa [Amycolatopsis sulphurea]|uniref:Guanyl-specific ribonuclease Sa n=1 Tax=Amycolatopsis sulphurea TaxID=76022 RepID=A0A2A9F4Z9_9PSEU|nr:ribonuclease domain-containing protein [Amycolatopsis sulphurea]PFG46394.1 guanyl-specific ribonuclease Sa [Amycolatopsis sulphurea]